MREQILYTPEEIAQKLKLSKYTIYEMIKRGEIPSHRIGRSLRISDTQLDAYLAGSKQTDNTFDAEISINADGEKVATVGSGSNKVDIVVSTDMEGAAKIIIKPEDVIISTTQLSCSARNNIPGTITGMEEVDNGYTLVINIGIPLMVSLTKTSVRELDLNLGDTVYAVFKAMSVIVV